MAVGPAIDDGATTILNMFQRDARAVLEQLLPILHSPHLYPDAFVDGWGDRRGGRATASTVVLLSPKAVKPPESTRQLARLRLGLGDTGEWTVIVSVVAQPDEPVAWPHAAPDAWWSALREKLRAGIVGYRGEKVAPGGRQPADRPAVPGPTTRPS